MLVSGLFAIVTVFALQVPPTLPPLPSPTPIATVTALPTIGAAMPEQQITEWLSTAAANINAMPEDIERPGGIPIVPDLNQNYSFFNYAKWLISDAALVELLGWNLADIARPFAQLLLVILIFASIALVFQIGTFLVRGIIWIIQNVMRFVPFLGAFMLIQMPTPTPMPIGPTPVLSIPRQDIWDFADDAVAWWNRLGSSATQTIQIVIIVMLIIVGLVFLMKMIPAIVGEPEIRDDSPDR